MDWHKFRTNIILLLTLRIYSTLFVFNFNPRFNQYLCNQRFLGKKSVTLRENEEHKILAQ